MAESEPLSTPSDVRAGNVVISPPRSRLRTILGTLLAVLMLTMVGLCGFGFYYFRPVLTENPAAVEPLTAQMLRIDIPPEFEPRGTIEWNFLWGVLMRGVYYELASDEGFLMLLQVDSRLMSQPDIQEHVDRTLRDKGGGGPPLEITESIERPFMVRGVNRMFRFRVGESPADHSRYHLVEGTVDGFSGTVLVAFRIEDAVWEELAPHVEQTIQSIFADRSVTSEIDTPQTAESNP